MKKFLAKIQRKAAPVILSIALLLTGLLAIKSIGKLEGDARVINYTGIVRGATQRLVKKELNHVQDDGLIERLDNILDGLQEGSRELRLIRMQSPEYQELIAQMEKEWTGIKEEIARYRSGGTGDKLFRKSESYFSLADRTVMAAEEYTEESVRSARNVLLYMNLCFVVLALCSALWVHFQERRQRELEAAEAEARRESERISKLSRQLMEPMNEISELMYVSDIHTYQLLFINKTGKETFHLEDNQDIKCYQALQGFDEPCPFCTEHFAEGNETYTWEYTNPLTKRHYLLKDRLMEWEGHMARMEIAFDITEADNEKRELKNLLDRDKTLLECIRELYRNHNLSEAIEYMLEQVGKQFLAERAYIMSFSDHCFTNTAVWCAEGVESQISNFQNIPKELIDIWVDMLQKQENIVLRNLDSLKDRRSSFEFMEKQGISRAVLVPLEQDGKLNGCIGLDNPPADMLEEAVPFLQTLRYFLMLAISRNKDEETLSRLSFQDTLTLFNNRNCYIQDIGKLAKRNGSVGVVFLDVNGLKEVNDTKGHAAGDRLLKDCAGIIRKVFRTGVFYRIGGDEFVIVCENIGEEEFGLVAKELKLSFQEGSCKAAAGSKWSASCGEIKSVIAGADELMYADKQAYYEKYRLSGRYCHQENGACLKQD